SSFDDSERNQSGDDLRESRPLRHPDDVLDVLVSPGGFLDDSRPRGRPEVDPALVERLHNLTRIVRPARGLSGHLTAGAVAARAEASLQPGRQAHVYERARAYVPRSLAGFADGLVFGCSLRL